MNTFTEENYLKCIYHLSLDADNVSTNQIAASLKTRPASVTDMLKKLSDKGHINYAKYQGVTLTPQGEGIAVHVIRKHRLWEYFLVEKLHFKWDEVHDVAEELEHISSEALVDRLDEFIGKPAFDPHGDPIPDAKGHFRKNDLKPIAVLNVNETGIIAGVRDHSSAFLQYLETNGLVIGKEIKVTGLTTYDHSVALTTANKTLSISREVANNLLIMT